MGKEETLKKAYAFFAGAARTTAHFTRDDVAGAVGWSRETVGDYFSKKLKRWVVSHQRGKTYTVNPDFARLSEDDFIKHMSQVARPTGYVRSVYDDVVQYEFLLPLTKEDKLRDALDDLFYLDTLERLVREMLGHLSELLDRSDGETDVDYIARAAKLTSRLFGGYSISHVRGRFRASSDVLTRVQAAGLLEQNQRYLIDETTAVVRFIIPFESSKIEHGETFDLDTDRPAEATEEAAKTLHLIRGLFFGIFVEAVVKTVKGEELIWLLEDSPKGRRLYELAKTSE